MKRNNLRVLYVEDDQDSCELVETILGFANIEVAHSASIDHAWKRAINESFDLFLLDGKVQDGRTLGLCGKLHKMSPGTPILFYSGLAGPDDIQNGLSAGATEYLVKPYFGNLAETLMNAVDNGFPEHREPSPPIPEAIESH
ncbi:MAG: response regulator [Pyrinomonadaceae bacterium]